MTYAYVTALIKLPNGQTGISSDWFDGVPEASYWTADVLETDEVDMAFLSKAASLAMDRKINDSGLPDEGESP